MYRGGQPPDDWRERRGFDGPHRNGPPPFPDRRGPGPAPPPVPRPPEPEIDREKTCPHLMRVFPKQGGHHKLEDYAKPDGVPAEFQIYTWMDATLRELCDLVKDVQPSARAKMARLSFGFVYPDRKGRNVMRQVGMVHSTRSGEDDEKTLRSLGFQIGDFLDVAIYS